MQYHMGRYDEINFYISSSSSFFHLGFSLLVLVLVLVHSDRQYTKCINRLIYYYLNILSKTKSSRLMSNKMYDIFVHHLSSSSFLFLSLCACVYIFLVRRFPSRLAFSKPPNQNGCCKLCKYQIWMHINKTLCCATFIKMLTKSVYQNNLCAMDTSTLRSCLCSIWYICVSVCLCRFAQNRTSLYIDCDAVQRESEQMRRKKNSFHVTLDFPIYRIMCVDCVGVRLCASVCVCGKRERQHTSMPRLLYHHHGCCCGFEYVYVLVLWDKRVKSISLDWMKMLYKSAIINVKMISKKPKSVFKHTAVRGCHSKQSNKNENTHWYKSGHPHLYILVQY